MRRRVERAAAGDDGQPGCDLLAEDGGGGQAGFGVGAHRPHDVLVGAAACLQRDGLARPHVPEVEQCPRASRHVVNVPDQDGGAGRLTR